MRALYEAARERRSDDRRIRGARKRASVGGVKGTVLLVEDERDRAELLARAIERAGWRCLVARDAPSARGRAREAGVVDVVVTDVVLGDDDREGCAC